MSYTEEPYDSKTELSLEEQLDLAILIAAKIHHGQKDKQGVNYILHPISVMMAASTLEEKVLAILHDTIEDSELTIEELRKKGFSASILEALSLITKIKEEDYFAYLKRVKTNALSLKVKILDVENNLRKGCPAELKKRYEKALTFLREEEKIF